MSVCVPSVDPHTDSIIRDILLLDSKNEPLDAVLEHILEHGLPKLACPSPSNSGKSVLVIGAGIAGLIGGYLLKGAGCAVTIVEANPQRIGGRIKTFHTELDHNEQPIGRQAFADKYQYAEAGAMRIPTTHKLVNTLIQILPLSSRLQEFYNQDVYYNKPSEKANNTWILVNDAEKPVRQKRDLITASKLHFDGVRAEYADWTAQELLNDALKDVLAKVNEGPSGWRSVLTEYGWYSTQEFLRCHPNHYNSAEIAFIGTVQNLTSRLHLSFFHTLVDVFYLNSNSSYVELRGGMYQLPEETARQFQLEKHIIMDARATCLYSRRAQNGAMYLEVKTHNETFSKDHEHLDCAHPLFERTFKSDYALITIPFSAVRLMDIPGLSYHKRRAIIELHYDSATKVLLEFRKRFWEWDQIEWEKNFPYTDYRGHDSVGGCTITDGVNRFTYFPSHPVLDRSDKKRMDGGVVVASYTWSDDSHRWDAIPDTDRYSQALDGLAKVYGECIKSLFTGYGQTESWMMNYYSLGEAAVFTPGQIFTVHPYTQSAELDDRVYFAGEHTSLKHAWIEGAIESAILASIRMYANMNGITEQQVIDAARAEMAAHSEPLHVPPKTSEGTHLSASKNGISSAFSQHETKENGKEEEKLPYINISIQGTGSPTLSTVSVTPSPSPELYTPSIAKSSAATASSISTVKPVGMTVAQYMAEQLRALQVQHIFSVAGNYVAPFLDTILHEYQDIHICGMPSELCAGYAADGYARSGAQMPNLGVVCTTFGVGALSILNAVAGASEELVPLVLINGGLTRKERQNQTFHVMQYSHTNSSLASNIDAFIPFTVSRQMILNAAEAPFQICAALSAAITYRKSVYIEVAEDVWRAEIPISAPLPSVDLKSTCVVSRATSDVEAAVSAAVDLISKYNASNSKGSKCAPLVWVGVEIHRYNLQAQLRKFLLRHDFPYITSPLAKSVLSESDPNFRGTHSPTVPSNSNVLQSIQNACCIIGFGAWTTSKNADGIIRGENVILAANNSVIVGAKFFPLVGLDEFIQLLCEKLPVSAEQKQENTKADKHAPPATTVSSAVALTSSAASLASSVALNSIGYDSFFESLSSWMRMKAASASSPTLVVDASFSLIGAQNVFIGAAGGFVAQASWLAIGYSLPAAIGVKLKCPSVRTMVVMGDGAFLETCSALSAYPAFNRNGVVFVLHNGIYGIEQDIVNPNPFRNPPIKYADSTQNAVFAYNTLPDWREERFANLFSQQVHAVSREIRTVKQLENLLSELDKQLADAMVVVRVEIPQVDVPAAIKQGINQSGEDEYGNKAYPPSKKF